jgi:two-component system sensor histidine kinase PilS (NtrC family)
MEESLEKSRKLALIGEMAAGLAHEMRNPLASITGSIELLSQGTGLEETDRRLMQIIMRSKNRLENFVRDFLMLARPIPVSRQVIDIVDVVEEVVENIRMSGDWKEGVDLKRNYAGHNMIQANTEQIRQVIQNLMTNALQAVGDSGNIWIAISPGKLEDSKNYIMIKISDDGCGIEEKDMNNILDPFYTNKEKGTGLGLAIVSRIVDGYGGRLKIASRPGEGTHAMVWLPSEQK